MASHRTGKARTDGEATSARIRACLRHAAPHNWLIHRIFLPELAEAARLYARGRLLDVGCAAKPWRPLFEPFVELYLGVDHAGSPHSRAELDVVATAYATGLASHTFDTVLCTAVLEHLERPEDALREVARLLVPGGHAILTVPLFWHLHEEPRDFYRFTRYGLAHLLERAGLKTLVVKPLSGFAVTFAQEACYVLERWRRGALGLPIAALQWLLQALAWLAHRRDHSHEFTWAYLVVARSTSG